MMVGKLRLQRSWSQEQLAEMSGLSVRTVQRIERNGNASTESLKALAAVFECDFNELTQMEALTMSSQTELTLEEQHAIEYVRDLKSFYSHALSYALTIPHLFFINYQTTDYLWAWWPALGWGIGLLTHALQVYEVFDFYGSNWEKRQVEKRLSRKL
ncbi:MAG: 2TM domain-containing protein [Halioglobus sp.]